MLENFGAFLVFWKILENFGAFLEFWKILEHVGKFWSILENFGTPVGATTVSGGADV